MNRIHRCLTLNYDLKDIYLGIEIRSTQPYIVFRATFLISTIKIHQSKSLKTSESNIWKKTNKYLRPQKYFPELLIKTCLILKDMLNMAIKGHVSAQTMKWKQLRSPYRIRIPIGIRVSMYRIAAASKTEVIPGSRLPR